MICMVNLEVSAGNYRSRSRSWCYLLEESPALHCRDVICSTDIADPNPCKCFVLWNKLTFQMVIANVSFPKSITAGQYILH